MLSVDSDSIEFSKDKRRIFNSLLELNIIIKRMMSSVRVIALQSVCLSHYPAHRQFRTSFHSSKLMQFWVLKTASDESNGRKWNTNEAKEETQNSRRSHRRTYYIHISLAEHERMGKVKMQNKLVIFDSYSQYPRLYFGIGNIPLKHFGKQNTITSMRLW